MRVVLGSSAVVVLVACALFATARGHLIELTAAMGILGFGVGAFSAAMPAVILTTPIGETSSAMAFNQVVRSAGFSLGSAVGGLVLTHPPTSCSRSTTATPSQPGSASPRWR